MGREKKHMAPPWMMYPQIPQGSIGWRMGYGEWYLDRYGAWMASLSKTEREEHDRLFPEPKCWSLREDNLLRHGSFWIYRWEGAGQPCLCKEALSAYAGAATVFFWGHQQKDDIVGPSCLSQWYPSEIRLGVLRYCCAEQYMMVKKAQLFDDTEAEKEIMAAQDPKTIKALGRKVRDFDGAVWDRYKYAVVRTGNYYKFSQHPELRRYLLGTGSALIAEASPEDRVWGIGVDSRDPRAGNVTQWPGQNLLGFALMEVREEIARVWKNESCIDWELSRKEAEL